jgi:hypothetical protein
MNNATYRIVAGLLIWVLFISGLAYAQGSLTAPANPPGFITTYFQSGYGCTAVTGGCTAYALTDQGATSRAVFAPDGITNPGYTPLDQVYASVGPGDMLLSQRTLIRWMNADGAPNLRYIGHLSDSTNVLSLGTIGIGAIDFRFADAQRAYFSQAGSTGGMLTLYPVTFANLPASPPDGSITYCRDCNAACTAGSSTGRICVRLNGAWTNS